MSTETGQLHYDGYNGPQNQCFTYDELDRLRTAYTDTHPGCDGHTSIGAGNYNDTYTYKAGGNLLTKTGTGSGTHNGTYTYGDPDHAHAVTATSDGSTFAYDNNGNMTTRNLTGQPAQTLVWDDGQRLESLTDSSGTTEFLYGIDDTRVRRETGGTYTYYHADGTEYEHDGTTGTFTYYHRINGKTVGYTRDGTTTWMFSDQIGSTSLTRTDTGVNAVQRYTPWGELRTNGSLTTDHHYTGQINDQTTGLNFYNARYQDPVLGRFISPDTIVPSPGNGQDYNRYSYVSNNPVKYSDPTGHVQTVGSAGATPAPNQPLVDMVLPGEDVFEAVGIWADLSAHCMYCEGFDIQAGSGLACLGLSGCTEALKYLNSVAASPGEVSYAQLQHARRIAATFCLQNNCGAGNASTLEEHINLMAATADMLMGAGFGERAIRGILNAGTKAPSGLAGGARVSHLGDDVARQVDDAIERAAQGSVRFQGHDGKVFDNAAGLLPPSGPGYYSEWTAAASGAKRGAHRVIVGGNPSSPDVVYYWDHAGNYVQVWP